MSKITIETEQIIAAALLLNFNPISATDLFLLSEDIKSKNSNIELVSSYSGKIIKYIDMDEGKICFRKDFQFYEVKEELKNIVGIDILNYLKDFSIEEFMLRKINHYKEININDVDNIFCKTQQNEIEKLDNNGYLTSSYEGYTIYDESKVIKLSDYGKVKLFKYENLEEINNFINELKSLDYDINLLDDFLLKQNLNFSVQAILTKDNFVIFCNMYDRAIYRTDKKSK